MHLWDPERFRYPWLADLPALQRRFGVEDDQEAVAGADVQSAVLVECDVDGKPAAVAVREP